MPYKSKAQQRYMHAASERGEVSKSVVRDFDKATSKKQFKRLPERVKKADGGFVLPKGYEIVSEGDKHFEVKGPNGTFSVAKRGLGKRTTDELHQHFAKGGQVQKLADGDEVASSLTGDPETDRMLAAAGQTDAPEETAPVFTGDPETDALIASGTAPSSPAIWGRQGYQPLVEPEPEPALTGDAALRADMARRAGELEAQRSADLAAGRPVAPPPPAEEARAVDDLGGAITPPAPMQRFITPEGRVAEQATARKVAEIESMRQRPAGGGGGGGGGVQGMIASGIQEQKNAVLAQAAVAKQEADAMSQAMQSIEERRALVSQNFQTQQQLWQARGDALKQKIMDSEIDPRAFWAKKDTGSKIQAAIAIALGAMGGALQKGPNVALQVIDQAIARDIDAQKANLGKTESLLSFHMQEGRDAQSAYQLTKADLLDAAAAQLKMTSLKYAGAAEQAQAEQKVGALSVQAGQLRMQVAAQQQAMALQGVEKDMMRLKMALLMKPKQPIEAQAVNMVSIRNPKTGESTQKPILQPVAAYDQPSAMKIRESTAGTMDALISLDGLEKAWKKLGPADIATPWDTQAESKYEASKVAVIGKMRLPLTGPGILTDNEVERILQAIPKKIDWTSRGQAKMAALKEQITAANQAVVQAYSLPPGQQRLGLLKGARQSLLSLEDL
jgi:hypothetical protein